MAVNFVELAERAKEQLAHLTGFASIAVVGARPEDGKGWQITVDVLEMTRIPAAADVIGTYVVTLDKEGNMVKFVKKRSHLRGEPYEEEKE